ncbi:hypothetical protein ACLOJK_011484 [Asimina triloba]
MADTHHPTIGNDSVHSRDGWRDDNALGWLTKIAIEMTLAAAAIVTQVATSDHGRQNAMWVKISISAMLISLSASLASALISRVYLRAVRILGHVGMIFSLLAITSLISVAVLGSFRWFSLLPCLVPLASLSKEMYMFFAMNITAPQPMAAASPGVSTKSMLISVMNGEHGLAAGSSSAAFHMEAVSPSSRLSTSQSNISSTSTLAAVSSINPHMSAETTCKAEAACDQSASVKQVGAEELINIVVETTN